MLRIATLLGVLGGCNGLLGVHTFESPSDAAGDGAATLDGATPCVANGHDEDLDGVADNCDDCPVDSDPGQTDMDGDGVGDACDPKPSTPGDKILFFTPFITADGYAFNGALMLEADDIRILGTTTVVTTSFYLPTRVEAGLAYQAPMATDVIAIYAGSMGSFIDKCLIVDGDPTCPSGQSCAGASVDNLNPTTVAWPSLATTDKLRLDVQSGKFACAAFAGAQQVGVESTPATVMTGEVGILTSLSGGDAAIVRYLIIYGR